MSDYTSTQFNLNRFFTKIHLKKQYLTKIQNNINLLNGLKEANHKKVGFRFSSKSVNSLTIPFVMYIIEISFSKKNTLFHIMDYSGNIKFFYSAGSFQQTGKGKIARSMVLRKFYRLLITKLKFVRKVPIAVHFRNTNSNMFWFLKKLKKKFFITVVKHFNQYPFNGCKKKKIRRKKFKSGSLVI
jgi:ribosomal protein S11